MDVTGRVEHDRLHFSCPQCNSTFAWQTGRIAESTSSSVNALCEDCGQSFSVRNPYVVSAAISSLVGTSTPLTAAASPSAGTSKAAQSAVVTITPPGARKFSIGSLAVALLAFLLPFSTL